MRLLQTGYNQVLERKNRDGSFNLWGYQKSDSIWLTAYILKCLGHVKHFISVNDIHIYDAMTFLASKQSANGDYVEHGPLSNRRIQGGVKDNVALVAFVAVSFLENKDYKVKFQIVIDKALSFVDKNVIRFNNNYAFAMTAYALVLGNRTESVAILAYMKNHAIVEEGKMFWENEIGVPRSECDTSLPLKIETAAYALLAFLKSGDELSAISIMNFLISKRNVDGGFYSTQDTVIGLQALSEIAKVIYKSNVDMKVKLNFANVQQVVEVKKSDELEKYDEEMPSNANSITINANGTGKALINIWRSYNEKTIHNSDVFKLNPQVTIGKDGGVFYLMLCVQLLPNHKKVSNMVITEVTLPSGYAYDSESTESLQDEGVKVKFLRFLNRQSNEHSHFSESRNQKQ